MAYENDVSMMLLKNKRVEPPSPGSSTMTFQGQGCNDHLCEKKGCGECVDDRFKPLLEFEFLDALESEMLAKLRELGWGPEMGSPIDYFDEHGDSLLHSAARKGDTKATKKLIDMGADVNVCCQGYCRCTPLMVACRWCRYDCARLLLEHNADIKYVNARGVTLFKQVANTAIGNKTDKAKILALLCIKHVVALAKKVVPSVCKSLY